MSSFALPWADSVHANAAGFLLLVFSLSPCMGRALSRRQYAALVHQANLLFLLGRGLLFDRAADDPLLQVDGCLLCSSEDGPEEP